MNTLYNHALKQIHQIRNDLEKYQSILENEAVALHSGSTSNGHVGSSTSSLASTVAIQGGLVASLQSLGRTVEDYEGLAKRELVKEKQEKALARVTKFKEDQNALKIQFDRLKSKEQAQRANSSRTELFATTSGPHLRRRLSDSAGGTAASDNPYAHQEQRLQESRQEYAHRENSFLGETDSKLDEFIEQGRAVLTNLVDQRQVLKGTQRKILSVTSTLGLSQNLVQQINRRSTQDKWILFAGGTFTLVCFYYIVRYLG